MLRASYYTLAALALMLLLVSCNDMNNNNPVSNSPNTVVIMDNSFNPQTLTVTMGSTVTWMNNGAVQHTVTSGSPTSNTGNLFDSGILPPGGSFSFTFSQRGQFPYFCRIHGASMSGTIIVQ